MALTESNLRLASSSRRSTVTSGSSAAGSDLQPKSSPQQSPGSGYLSPSQSASGWQFEMSSEAGSQGTRRSTTSRPRTQAGAGEDNVKVICRVRPFNQREFEINTEQNSHIHNEWEKIPLRSVVEMEKQDTVFLDHEKEYHERDRFRFDASLWSMTVEQQESPNGFCSQEKVMSIIGEPSLQHIWTGYNTTVFAYGQTGSGKTYTMMGTEDEVGLIPRICKSMFDMLEQQREHDKQGHQEEGQVKEYKLEAKFLEIYNERVRDLLWDIRPASQPTEGFERLNMKVRNIPNKGPEVMGITCVCVDTPEDCLRLISEGTKNRSVAATKMNAESSRSHSIFRLTLTQTTKIMPTKQFEKPKTFDRTSVVSLVDLAGSERNKKTGAEGARLKEAVAINQSLTTLKNVIDALVESRGLVPYRESQLTWLLSESLGGNSKTFMIACISPHSDNAEETLNTLRYAARAQKIVTHAQVNESEEMRRMTKMREALDRLQKEIDDNPSEMMLEEEYQEQTRRLQELQEESIHRRHEIEALRKLASRHKDMRYTQTFQHAFRALLYRRMARKYDDNNVLLKQRVEVRESETAHLREGIAEVDAETKKCREEETTALAARQKREDRLATLQQNCASLDDDKMELVTKEDHLKEAQAKKMDLVNVARQLGKILCAHRRYVFERKIERLNNEKHGELRRLADEQLEWNLGAEEAHNEKMQRLTTEEENLREKIDDLQYELERNTKQKSEKITSLHAACIFYENETKRCVPDLDRNLSSVNKSSSEKYYSDKEAWAKKTNEVLRGLDLHTSQASEEHQARNSAAEIESMQEIDNADHAGREAHESTIKSFERQLKEVDEKWSRRLKMLEALNIDTDHFLRESRHAEPRYTKLYESVANLVNPEESVDAQVTDIAKRLRKVTAALESVTPQPFQFQNTGEPDYDACQPAPMYGKPATPRRHRPPSPEHNVTLADTSAVTPHRLQRETTVMSVATSATTGTARRRPPSPTPSHRDKAYTRTGTRTMDLAGPFAKTRTDLERPISLLAPKKVVPATTKASRLRAESASGRQVQQAANGGTRTGTNTPVSSPVRAMTPRTARSTLAYLLTEEQQKVAVGDTYFMSRNRTPTLRVYRSESPVAPAAASPFGHRSRQGDGSGTPLNRSRASTPLRR